MRTLCCLVMVTVLLSITGCKIVITVPDDGTVETSSGDYFCPSGETCVVEVTDTFFDQEFIAVPSDGSVFVAWRRVDRGFCGGRAQSCRLSTAAFEGNDDLLAILASDERYYLSPLFAEPDSYRSGQDMPVGGAVRASCTVNGKLYVFGGGWETGSPLDSTQEYDPVTDTWRRRANMPTPRAWATASAFKGECYVMGGSAGGQVEAVVEAYNPRTNSWRSRARLPEGRFSASSVTLGKRIYMIGGSGGDRLSPFAPAEASVFIYNPARNRWSAGAEMPTARRRMGVGTVDGLIYAVGGANRMGGFEFSDTVERYDPVADEWQTLDPAPAAFTSAAVVALNDYLYVFGGFAPQPLTRSFRYDPAANRWRRIADLPEARGDTVAEKISGQIIIAGGRAPDHQGTPIAATEVYTPQ
ncbi:hypothetical protein E2F43_07250 [Seongchinamella unica]|uniref:N-acetylneuraminate epimerase n=1 Tax=Seongchinamella unica TaxID=2547392 RepID=A0A4R5LR66_9GAMM|nr:kelch repeat-containing protein [Seongchinamella unica]TDG13332.1 hypothetical protein E2F43_07250 [Seongchinamella unica]